MRAFAITHAQLRTCPHVILAPEHWREDGTCLCQAKEDRMPDDVPTIEQGRALARLLRDYRGVTNVVLRYGPFDLPEGYIEFTLSRGTEHVLTGGIDPDGVVST